MSSIPDASVIEIVERGRKTGPGHDSLIVPDDVRINGVSILVPEQSITVHEISPADNSLVQVTLTLYARRVVIGAELD